MPPRLVQIIDLDGISSDMEDIRQEVATLRLCLHPNVLRFHASFVECRERHELWLVTQLMAKGSCLHAMTAAKPLGLPPGMHEDWVVWILREALLGLKYFHEHQQIHRDIKAGNILLGSDGRVALADFGVSRWINKATGGAAQNDGRAKTFVGTPCWMAPEVMEQLEGYDYKADIWSLGITALELAKGHAPYASFAPMKVLLYTIQNDPPSLASYPDQKRGDERFSWHFEDLIHKCLQKDPAKRPTCAKLLTHALFNQPSNMPSGKGLVADLLDRIGDVDALAAREAVGSGGGGGGALREPGTEPVDVAQLMEGMPRAALDAEGEEDTIKAGSPAMTREDVDRALAGGGHPEEAGAEDAPAADYPMWSFDANSLKDAAAAAGIILPSVAAAQAAAAADAAAEAEAAATPPGGAEGMPAHLMEPGLVRRDTDPQTDVPLAVDRSRQDDFAQMMGGVELMSEEEMAHQERTASQAAEEAGAKGNEEVFSFIASLGATLGGEFTPPPPGGEGVEGGGGSSNMC